MSQDHVASLINKVEEQRSKKQTYFRGPVRNFVVSIVVKEQDEEIETGLFGPLTENEADGFCRMFQNMEKAEYGEHRAMLCIKEMSNPWTFGITPDLRAKLYGV